MYNNQYGGSRSQYGFTPYANRNGRPMNYGYNQNTRYSRNAPQIKKHSGCSSGLTKKDQTLYVRGWKFDKRNGLRSFIAGPNKNTSDHKSKTSGRVWQNWTCKITEASGQSFLTSCLYDTTTGKVIINDLGFVMNPKARNGGYVGTFVNKG